MLKNINTKQRGFTLVELLIVIVVIAILAAISIIAYNGITNRGKASSAQSLASQISKKAESWNTIQGSYATLAVLKTGDSTNALEAKLDNPDVIVAAGAAGSEITAATAGVGGATGKTAGNGEVVAYKFCSATNGVSIYYWDASAKAQKKVNAGAGC